MQKKNARKCPKTQFNPPAVAQFVRALVRKAKTRDFLKVKKL